MTSDDKFAEVYFKEMLSLEEQLEYAMWMDTLVEFGFVGNENPEDVDAKMFRMLQCDINQETIPHI